MPFGIGDPPPPDQFPADKQYPAATITLQQVLDNLPEGLTLYSLSTHGTDAAGNSKQITDRAPAPQTPLQPGDAIEIRGPGGLRLLTSVNADATDIGELTQIAGPSTKESTGKDYLPADQIAPHATQAQRDQYTKIIGDDTTSATLKQQAATALRLQEQAGIAQSGKDQAKTDAAAKADAQDRALAASAMQKMQAIQAGRKNVPAITSAEAVALNKVASGELSLQGAGSTSGAGPSTDVKYAMPIEGYSGPISPHHAGAPSGAVDFAQGVGPGTVVHNVVSGTVQMSNPNYGTAGPTVVIAGDDGRTYMYQHLDPNVLPQNGAHIDTGQAFSMVGPVLPGENSTGPHLHVAVSTSGMKGFETQNGTGNGDALGILTSIAKGQQPAAGPGGAIPGLGNPGGLNPFGTPAEPKAPQFHWDSSGHVYAENPDGTIKQVADFSDQTMPTHINVKSGGRDVVLTWDPNSKQLVPSYVGEPDLTQTDMGKITTMIQQYGSSVQAVQAAYKAGTINTSQLQDYTQHLSDYVDAALQGTTPWDRIKFQQDQDAAKQKLAGDLLDKSVANTTKTAQDMLSNSLTSIGQQKYSAMGLAPDTLYNLFQGGATAGQQQSQPLTDLAHQLLSSVGTKALSAGLDPRTNVLTGQTDPSALLVGAGTGPNDSTLSNPQPATV